MQYGTWDDVSICGKQTTLPMCKYISKMIDYSFNIAFIAMRNKQDEITDRLEKELDYLATQDLLVNYILISVCIALVIISALVIIPIFVKVIKDKSNLYMIFSHITEEELNKIVSECKKLILKNVRYKKKWLLKSYGNQDHFWRKIVTENKMSNQKPELNTPKNEKEPNINLLNNQIEIGKKEDKTLQPLNQADSSPVNIARNNDHQRRAELLSEIDYALRNRSILRLAIAVGLFLLYAVYALYFNYFVHDVNSGAVKMFFVLHKRAIYAASTALFLKEAIVSGDKKLIAANTSIFLFDMNK